MSTDRRKRDAVLIVFNGDMETDLFNGAARDRCHEPYILWREGLERSGYGLEQADNQRLDHVAGVVYWDGWVARASTRVSTLRELARGGRTGVHRNWLAAARRQGVPAVLILWEPPVVAPEYWDPELLERFPTILTYDDDLVDGKRFLKCVVPQCSGTDQLPGVPFAERRDLTAITGNKTSVDPGELYSVRFRSFAHFAARDDVDFDLYGLG